MAAKSPNRSGYFTVPVAPDFLLEIAKGRMPGYRSNQILAVNRDVNASHQTVWDLSGAEFQLFSAPKELFVSSTDPGDSIEVKVQGVDGNFVEKEVIVNLNGQNQVSVGDFHRVNKTRNNTTTELLGAIYVAEADTLTGGKPDTDAKVQDIIPFDPDVGRSYSISASGIFTVPANHTLFMFVARMYVSNLGPTGRMRFFLIRESCINQSPGLLFGGDLGVGASDLPLSGFRQFPEKTTLSFSAIGPAGGGATISMSIDSVLVENEEF